MIFIEILAEKAQKIKTGPYSCVKTISSRKRYFIAKSLKSVLSLSQETQEKAFGEPVFFEKENKCFLGVSTETVKGFLMNHQELANKMSSEKELKKLLKRKPKV